MPNLIDGTKQQIEYQENKLRQMKEALALIEKLPPEIQALQGSADTGWFGCALHLSFWGFEHKDKDLLKTLKMAGVQGLVATMGATPDYWDAQGQFAIPDGLVKVNVYSTDKPRTCRIEEYEETQVVKKYKVICPETNEELAAAIP